jgi:hypothetical protein
VSRSKYRRLSARGGRPAWMHTSVAPSACACSTRRMTSSVSR